MYLVQLELHSKNQRILLALQCGLWIEPKKFNFLPSEDFEHRIKIRYACFTESRFTGLVHFLFMKMRFYEFFQAINLFILIKVLSQKIWTYFVIQIKRHLTHFFFLII